MCYSYKSYVIAVRSRSASIVPASTRRASGTLLTGLDTTTQSSPSSANSSLIANLDAFWAMDNAVSLRTCLSKKHGSSQCSIIPVDKLQVVRRFCNSNFRQLPTSTDHTNDQSGRGGLWNRIFWLKQYLPRIKIFHDSCEKHFQFAVSSPRELQNLDENR